MEWKGLRHYANILLHGGVNEPLLKYDQVRQTPSSSKNYESMHEYYRHYRRDEMVRRCTNTNAYFATMTAGFETELEPTDPDLPEEQKEQLLEEYAFIKEFVDQKNKDVNMDQTLFVSQVKRSVYGNASWEIIFKSDAETPDWLLSLPSKDIKPDLNDNWELIGYKLNNKPKYGPTELLYFPNLVLEADMIGLSDVEPVADICEARHDIIKQDFKETAHRLWAPYVGFEFDFSGKRYSKEYQTTTMQNAIDAAKAGKGFAVNEKINVHVVSITPNITGLVEMLNKLEEAIMRQYGVPKFLLGKEIVNRATAYAELEAYADGVLANIQRFFKRELERQWYDRLTKVALKKHGKDYQNPPVVVKHKWNKIRTADIYQMATAVANLYAQGLGLLADDQETCYDMLGLDKDRLKEIQEQEQQRLKEMLKPEQKQA